MSRSRTSAGSCTTSTIASVASAACASASLTRFQQDGTEHDISVLTAFPAPDVDDHASAVDVGELQASQLGSPRPGAVERHQYHAMKSGLGRVDEEGNFFWAQYAGQVSRLLGIRWLGHAPCLLNGLDEEEPQ